ncbi:hypothetical protein Tco_1441471, partial [Tanacetum coccineum]
DDDDDDDVNSDADGDNEASDSEKTDSDKVENPNLNQNDDEEEEYEEEYVRTPDSVEFIDDDEEYEELYKDVNIRLQATEHEEEGKRDEEIIDVGRDEGTQQTTYEHFISSDFASQFLNLDNVLPTDIEVVSMFNVNVRHEEPSTQTPPLLNIPITVISETSIAVGSIIPPTIPPITPLQQQSTPTPTPAPTTVTTTTLVPALLDFSSLFGFDQRVSALEKELSQFKQAEYSAQLLETIKSQIPAMVDVQLSIRLEDSIKKYFRSYTAEFEKKAKDERKRYIDLVEKSVKEIIKDEVKKTEKDKTPTKTTLQLRSEQGLKTQKDEKGCLKPFRGSKSKQNHRDDLGNTDDQSNIEAASRDNWFKKPERPLTLDSDLNTTKTINFRPPQTWIIKIAKAGKPPLTFDELMSTPIDFSARVELKYHFEECYKAFTDRRDWTNPEGHEYPFDLSKPLPLIEDQGRQVANYFFNNDLEYLKG